MTAERRKHIRLPITMRADLILEDGTAIEGQTKDISFGGAFLYCKAAKPSSGRRISPGKGTNGVLRIILQNGPAVDTIEIECFYVRSDKKGMAVQFTAIELTAYNKFVKMMIYNAPDPERLSEALAKNPGLLIKGDDVRR